MRKILFPLVVITLSLSCVARADDVTKRAKVEEMLTLLNMEQNFQAMQQQGIEQGKQVAQGMLGSQPLSDADKASMDRYMSRMMAVIQQTMSWEKLKPEFVTLYASHYTEEELDGILAFYKSPVGRSMLAKTPELIKASGQISQSHVRELQPKMIEAIEQLKTDLEAAHSASPSKK